MRKHLKWICISQAVFYCFFFYFVWKLSGGCSLRVVMTRNLSGFCSWSRSFYYFSSHFFLLLTGSVVSGCRRLPPISLWNKNRAFVVIVRDRNDIAWIDLFGNTQLEGRTGRPPGMMPQVMFFFLLNWMKKKSYHFFTTKIFEAFDLREIPKTLCNYCPFNPYLMWHPFLKHN